MNIESILSKLYDLGIKISVVENKLKIQATKEKVPAYLLDDIKSNKLELIAYLKGKGKKNEFIEIKNIELKDYYSLSSAQKRMYLLQQFDLTSTAYNMPNLIPLEKEADKEKIEEVFKQIIKRHENFRTSINIVDEVPVQLISKDVEFKIEKLSIEKPEIENTRNKFIKPFDLSKAPLLRAAIIDIKGEDSLLMIDMHHIISDGISHTILENEFQSLLSGEELSLLPLQYRDYSQWQNSKGQQERVKNQEQYWLTKFEGEIPVLNLPMDYVRPLMQSHEGAIVNFVLSKEETEGIKSFTKENDLTLYMSLLSAFSILLSKLSGQNDIVVGTPIAGRNYADLENIVGMFINTLSIRNEVKGEETIQEFVSNLKQTVLGAYENQNYQFEDLVDKVSVERDTSRNPIFDVVINLLNQTEHSVDLAGIDNQNYIHTSDISKFDLTLTAADYGEQLMLSFEYCTQLFKAETIDRFIVYFKKIVSQISQNPEKELSELEIISAEEKQQILYAFNDTQVSYPSQKSIPQIFDEQVKEFSKKIALEDKHNSYTYQDLDEESNKIANYLIKCGVKEGQLVGLMAGRTSEMIIGILGILKTGGAYVPIDPAYPKERVNQLIEDSGINILLSTEAIDFECNLSGGIINISDLEIKESSTDLSLPSISSSNIAYVMYTSGSTGTPKGVVIEQKSVLRLVQNNQFFPFHSEQKILLTGAPVFDATTFEIWGALLNGGSLYIASNEVIINSELLGECIRKNSITSLWLTSSLFNQLLDQDESIFDTLKFLLIGGDVLSVKHINKVRRRNKDLIIINGYGPTENTSFSTTFNIDKEYKGTIPIGKPISNSTAYIFDKSNRLQVVGVSGELLVGGDGLAREYLNNPELTREKFIENPYKPEERLYKTGDLARWLPDGNIEFLGRIDHQVKIRGFRIELGEIESVLLKHENIKENVVLAIEKNNEKYLCAYIVSKEELNHEELKTYMSVQLPDYMIPSYFVELDSLPLNANGKVNRKALPSPEIKAGDDYVAPSNEIEEKLVKIWSEVLKVPQEEISTTASFFAIGGHSLKATILVSKIHKELSVKLPLKEIFRQQTIKKMAACISEVSKLSYSSITFAEKKEYYALSSAQKRLYFIQQMDIQSISYNMPIVIPMGLGIKTESLENAFAGLVSRHESFRTSFITINNEPVQRIYDKVDFKLDKKETTRENLEKDIKEYIRPFDLSKDLLIRACLMNVSNKQSVLVVDMHHIISDGTTSNIVREDFLKMFNGEKTAPLKLQYKDFSNWQNKLIAKGGLKSQETYWKDLFSGDIPMLNLQTDYKRPENFTFKGDTCRFSLNEDETSLLKDLGKGMGSTLYMNILAVLNTLFYRFSNQEDIIIGSGIAGRQHSDLQGISGMFVNTLAMRNYPNGDKTYLDFLKEVSDNSIAAFENQDIQFEDLVDMLNIDRDISRNPLFDVSMLVQNFGEILSDQESEDLGGKIEHLPKLNITRSTSKFDMTFFVWETVNKTDISIEYYTGIFKRETIEKYIRCFKSIVSSIIKNPKVKLKEIELLSQEEKQQLLYEFNDTQSNYPKDKTIHGLFEEQVDKTPDNIALVCNQEQITYKELDNKSNQIAQYLRFECEVSINESIGIYMDKGTNVIISILGILKSGCGYLPLSESFPEERIKFMINDTSTRIILSEKRYLKEMNKFQWECSSFRTYLCLDSNNVYEEQEIHSSLNDRKLWEYVGDESVDEITGGGWSSSYTGKPIPREEMDEYGDNVLKKLEPHITSQTRILEIGCASGISMFKLAPKVELYYGTDLSGTILEKNEERINSEKHFNIIQKRLSADEIDQIEEKDFDIVIINSVIQCFDGHNYLKKVIRKAIDLMKPEGLMFFGDIMDQDLKNDLLKELKEFKRTNKNEKYKTKTDWSQELFLSRGFWNDLKCEETSIKSVESGRKIFTLENELTKYRYDVLITINKDQEERVSIKEKNKFQHDLNILSKHAVERLPKINSSEDLAYIIYTSGSTGNPKGVIINHSNISPLLHWGYKHLSLDKNDKVIQNLSYYFDWSVWEIFIGLTSGASLNTVSKEISLDIEKYIRLINKNNITVLHNTPIQFQYVASSNQKLKSIKHLCIGAEKLTLSLVKQSYEIVSNDCSIYNMYGPTEASIMSAVLNIGDSAEDKYKVLTSIPIGGPIANGGLIVLNQYLQMQPVNIAGELYISGDGLSKGYLNDPEKTGNSFIKNIYKSEGLKGDFLYKTGDMVRWLSDGSVEFLGRIDHQVKIRGFRIELGEIENVLLKHDNIKECIVTAIEEHNEKYLCAYIVSKEKLKHEELRTYMSEQLPDYMVPSYFSELDKLPLSPNGKVNRKALPSPQIKAGDDYVAPSNQIEAKLLEIWSKVLNIEKENISVNTNFFSIGGHSLKATVLTSKINKEIGVEFPLRDVSLHSTIKLQVCQIERSTKIEFVSIPKAQEQSNYPLSSAQKRLYLLQQFDLTSTAYNMPYIIPLGKEADKSKIEEVFKQLINRHESFRTSIIVVDQEPVQQISKSVEFELEKLSIENTEVENTRNKFIKPFDLSKAPYLRATIVDIKGEDSLLMIDMHHIISDGTSHAILEKEFQALVSGEELSPLPLQYKDYSEWQNSKKQQEIIKDQEQYWLNEFEGEIPVLNLPIDYARPLMQSHEGATVNFVLSKEETEGIRFFTKENDLTLYMSLLSVFSILLSKLSGQDDIVVGTPIAGRNHADLENIVGMFVNTLSIRNEVKGEETIRDFVSSLKQTVLGAYENQNYQFEDLVDKVSVERDAGRNPIFDVMINLLNQAEYSGDLSGINKENLIHTKGVSKFDLTLTAIDYEEQLLISFNYCTQLFKAETIDRFIVYFKQIVSQIARKAEIKISAIDILTEDEKHQLLCEFNNTETDYPKDKTIHELFEEQVEKTPEKEAVVFEGISISYNELNQKSNQIAYYLRNKGITRNSIVTLILEPSHEMIICLLGVLKSGASYLPVNPELPENRISYLLRDSECSFILTNISSYDKNLFEIDLIYVDDCFFKGESENLKCVNTITDSIYVIYTSGTTGKPKGVVLTHENLLNYISWFNDISKLNQNDKTALITSYSFDLGYTSVFSSLLKGCELHILQKDLYLSSSDFNSYVVDNRISYLKTTPSLYSTMVDCEGFDKSVNCLRLVLLGGEAIKTELIERSLSLNENLQIINHYGPTEATIGCITSLINKEKLDAFIKCPVIGKPINNTEAYVLNETMDLLPIGSSGELCISGDGLAVGYLNESLLTDEKFISHPFKKGKRLYKTGDLARCLPDGEIEFLGRVDYQVKIRGFRIELGEIEYVLSKHENIKESVVIAIEENNDKYLCAYIVSREELNQEELRAYMSAQLPDYMVPAYFVELESLPRTANGKVNRKVLPLPEIKAGDDYVAPSNETEEKIVEIWSEVLNIEKEEISTTANFFSIGGHSLKVLNVVSAIKEKFGINLPLMHIYRASNIKTIAIDILSKEFASNDF
ncbi:MAG: amino acid adenylation domain-containing protein, partial [Bacteroidales bacterium]|nr:amino acid adenylation domain-containing protein [Bacteroidales bacterium]